MLFDKTNPKHQDYMASLMMAAMLTFMRYGDKASEFWIRYGENKGVKSDNGVDGVQALRNLVGDIRKKKHFGQSFDAENIGQALHAYEYYRRKKLYPHKNGLPYKKKSTELDIFLEAALKNKGKHL